MTSTPDPNQWWADLDTPRARVRTGGLDRAAIVKAAVHVLDGEGVDGLNMRRIADELGTGASSLYRHVPSKEILADLVFDAILGELRLVTPSEDWRNDLVGQFMAYRKLLRQHQDLARLANRPPRGRNTLRAVEHCLQILHQAGFSAHGAAEAYIALANYATGFCLLEVGAALGTQGTEPAAYQEYLRGRDVQELPHVVEAAAALGHGNENRHFRSGLESLARGLHVS